MKTFEFVYLVICIKYATKLLFIYRSFDNNEME